MHDITEGGILGAVWEMCQISGTGAEVWENAIPIALMIKLLATYDKTIDGEFTDNNGTWIQKNGVTFCKKDILNQTKPYGSSDPYTLRFLVEFYNGNPDKLEFEIENPIKTVLPRKIFGP